MLKSQQKWLQGEGLIFYVLNCNFCGAVAYMWETLKIWAWKLFVATLRSPCAYMLVLSLLYVLCLLSVTPLKSALLWALPLIILRVFNVCECVNVCLAMHCLSFLSFSFFLFFFSPRSFHFGSHCWPQYVDLCSCRNCDTSYLQMQSQTALKIRADNMNARFWNLLFLGMTCLTVRIIVIGSLCML